MAEKIKRTLQVPHTYTIIFVLMILVAVQTWIVPTGAFDTTEVGGREVTVSGTYQEIDKVIVDEETGEQTDLRQGVDAVLQAPLQGIEAAVEVVAFIFIVGGSPTKASRCCTCKTSWSKLSTAPSRPGRS